MVLRAGNTGRKRIVYTLTVSNEELILHLQKLTWSCHEESKQRATTDIKKKIKSTRRLTNLQFYTEEPLETKQNNLLWLFLSLLSSFLPGLFCPFWATVENLYTFFTPQLRKQSYCTSYFKTLPERLLELFMVYCDNWWSMIALDI